MEKIFVKHFGTEITGLYYKDLMSFICYIIPISNKMINDIFNLIYEKESLVLSERPYYIKNYNKENDICCIKVNDYYDYSDYNA